LIEVIKAVRQCPAPRKLLILDVMRPIADPRLGMLTDDLADHVQQLLEQEVNRSFFALCACSKGQVSLVSEQLGQSVFGYYLAEGMRGIADDAGNRDHRVSVKELAKYVSGQVDFWALRNRATRQTPVLLGENNSDFELARGVAEHVPQDSPGDYPGWLRKYWELRDNWWDNGTYRLMPQAYRLLEATLLHGERRWRGGEPPAEIQNYLDTEISRLSRQVETARADPAFTGPRHSLAQEIAGGTKKPDPKEQEALSNLLREAEQAVKPGEMLAPGQLPDKLKDYQKKHAKDPLPLVLMAFELAVGKEEPSLNRIRLLDNLIQTHAVKSGYAETKFLHRLAEWRNDKHWPARTVRLALRVRREAARALSCEPRVFPWVRESIEAAAKLRRDAEALLLKQDAASSAEAERVFADAERRYRQINEALDSFHQASHDYDQALVLLPAYLPYLTSRRRIDRGQAEEWISAVGHATKLGELLSALPGADHDQAARQVQEVSANLQARLDRLGEHYRGEVSRLHRPAVQPQANAADLLAMDALFESPFWQADRGTPLRVKDREALWKTRQLLAGLLNAGPTRDRPGGEITGSTELDRARLRARCALALLKLGKLETVPKLEEEWTKASESGSSAAWQSLGEKLRHAWAVQLPAEFAGADVAMRDLISRVVHPFDLDKLVGPNPTVEIRRREATMMRQWLSKQDE
jgi:hypothetical protein